MRIVMLGAPGSGKGTQAQRLQKEFGFPQVSTGDLLRRAIADKTPIGVQAKAIVDAGNLVPDEMVLGMIEERIAKPDAANGFILDGYPRNSKQAADLDAALAKRGWTIDAAVLMDVDFDILMKRLTGRRTCSKTGAVLNIYFSTPEELEACTKAGGELIQRADDNEATIGNRLKVYEAQTAPLIAHYRGLGLLKTVTATGEVDEVYARLTRALGLASKAAPAASKNER
jgi:adenylate kinase